MFLGWFNVAGKICLKNSHLELEYVSKYLLLEWLDVACKICSKISTFGPWMLLNTFLNMSLQAGMLLEKNVFVAAKSMLKCC